MTKETPVQHEVHLRIATCVLCVMIYDPTTQGHCPRCGRHPHLDEDCDHDCDRCASVLFPPKGGHLDLFRPSDTSSRWQRVRTR